MRGLKRNPWLFGLGVLLAVLVVYGGHARADVTSDQSGSIVIFPKVIADGTRDTLIQITNTSNMTAQAHCFYVASGSCSATATTYCNTDAECPVGETCLNPCNETNFDIFLTAQQPTFWRASTGRVVSDPRQVGPCRLNQPCACSIDIASGGLACPGFDPGTGGIGSQAVKPTGTAFQGELKCILTDSSSPPVPIGQNSLKGEAIIEDLATGQVSEYNAYAVAAIAVNNNDDLLLDGTEYNFCPHNLILNHYADGADVKPTMDDTDPFFGVTVSTELTLVPCTEILEQQFPTHARALFSIVDEFESPLSASITFECLLNRGLADISSQFTGGLSGAIPSTFAKTRITPPSGSICYTGSERCHTCNFADPDPNCAGLPPGTVVGNCDCTSDTDCPGFDTSAGGTTLGCKPWSGLLGVAEEFYLGPGRPRGTAAFNPHLEGTRAAPGDFIIVPAGQ
jgi:hypothetical protein